MDFINDFLNDLPRRPLLGLPHRILRINDYEDDAFNEFMNALLNDLPQRPFFGLPHLIPPVNDEEDDEIEVDVVDVPVPAHAQPLPVYGPSHVFENDLIATRLPDHLPEYSGTSYFGLEEEYEDEDQNIEGEEDREDEYQDEDQNIEEEEDLEDVAEQGPIKRPISTNQSLEDMIKSSGGERFIATIGLQERNTTESAFEPILEPR